MIYVHVVVSEIFLFMSVFLDPPHLCLCLWFIDM